MRIKLIQCGDLHLDAPFTSLSDMDGKPEQRRNDLKMTLSRIIDAVLEEEADLLLVCGDLYEHNYIRKSTIHFICDQFSRIQDVPVLLIPGNHDPAVPGSYYNNFSWPSNVHILGKDMPYEHISGTRVYGAVPSTGSLDLTRINIFMFHGTLDMPFSKDAFQPVSGSELEAYGFDYYALGHFHSRIDGAGAGKTIYNAGSPEPLGFDEEGDHGVYVAEISKESSTGAHIHTRFIRLCRRRFINQEVQITGCLTNEQAAALAAAAMEQAGCADDLYKITFSGYLPHDFRIDTELIMEILKNKAFYIKISDYTTPDYDFEQIAEEPGLRGLFVRKMLDRAISAQDAEEKELIMQALYYGMQAIDEGKICI